MTINKRIEDLNYNPKVGYTRGRKPRNWDCMICGATFSKDCHPRKKYCSKHTTDEKKEYRDKTYGKFPHGLNGLKKNWTEDAILSVIGNSWGSITNMRCEYRASNPTRKVSDKAFYNYVMALVWLGKVEMRGELSGRRYRRVFEK